jgi:hypothetical protein
MVDIEARRKAGNAVGFPRLILAMRYRHGTTGTGCYMKRWKYRSMVKFPHCGHHDERESHLTICEDAGAI